MSELGAVSGQLLRDLSGQAKELEDGGKAQVRVLRQIGVRKSYLHFPAVCWFLSFGEFIF